jgi:hypothetical protein
MRFGRRTSTIGAALLTGVLVLAACGGDDGASSADTTSAAAATTAAPGSGGADTTSGGDSATTTAIDTNFSGAGSEEFCTKLREFEDSPVLQGDPSFDDPEALKTQYEAIQDAIGQLADVAPGEIQDDIDTMQSGLGDLIKLFEEYDYDFAKIMEESQSNPDLATRVQSFGTGEMDAASQRLTAYGEQVCGITDTTAG